MPRNRAPSVNLTKEQRSQIDDVVLRVVRERGELGDVRLSEILGNRDLNQVLAALTMKKADYRLVGEALQRLKHADKVELRRGRWRTTSPTA